MIKLGFNMIGTETVFEQMLRGVIKDRIADGRILNYVEIGIAEGTTLSAVGRLFSGEKITWRAIGVDLVDGAFFNARDFIKANLDMNVEIVFSGANRPTVTLPSPNLLRVMLLNPGMDIRHMILPTDSISFCLIDGCHGKPCVMRDFIAVEPWIAPGGIVAFHDAMPEDQGQGFQHHCQMPITVQDALMTLGLDSQTVGLKCSRPGWTFVAEAHGDKSANPPGNGFAFFQKNAVTGKEG